MTFRVLGLLGAAAAFAAAQSTPASDAKPSSAKSDSKASATKSDAKASATKKTWTAPRTADGHPDLQGVWTNATLTPLERAPQFATKATLTEDEAAKAEASAKGIYEDVRSSDAERDRDHAYNSLFFDRGSSFERVDGQIRTSLIIDPPDGRIPRVAGAFGRGGRRGAGAATAAAAPAAAEEGAARGAAIGRFDSVKDRPLGERCLLGFGSTSGPPMMPVLYNNNYQIVQTPDSIMILVEMVHDVRLIRMDGGPHLPPTVRKWLGDSIGHWEGDTLVVDTTNFTNKTHYQGATPDLHVIERFKRVDEHTILYRFTVEDPAVFTRPWTAEYPFLATDDHIYEYACHEGNYAMPDILGGARKDDEAAKKNPTK
jgi:hypothetical protein